MADPVFDITICTNSKDTRVLVNDDDITLFIRSIRVEQKAGDCPIVHLELIGNAAAVRVKAALDRYSLEVPTADVTPLGAEFEVKTVLL